MTNSIATLSDLKAHFEQATSNQELALTPENSVVARLSTFVASLQAGQIKLSKPDLQLADDSLTMVAATADEWSIGDSGRRTLHVSQVQVVFTMPPDFVVELHVSGSLTIGGRTITVSGAFGLADQFEAHLGSGSTQSLPLSVLADYISENQLGYYLPVGVAIFDSVPLSALRLSLGYGRTAVTQFEVSSELDAEWPLINGLSSLTGIGVTLTSREDYRYGNTIGGNIHATLRFEKRDFTVRIALRGQNDWALEIIPADGNLLPSLDALAKLASGELLAQEVQAGLKKLGLDALAVDGVSIRFDLAKSALRNIEIRSHVTINDITFNIQVALPNFAFHGNLSPSTPIHLKTLVGNYFSGAENFPTVDITQFNIAAVPGIGRYSLFARITSDWDLDVGPIKLGFHEFAFEIVKEPTELTGAIEGYFSLFDASFLAAAEHPEAGAGWQFSCRSLPGQPLTIKAIHDQVATKFNVDATVPAAIEELKLENLDVWFDTASGDFRFFCDTKFPVHDQEVDITVTIILDKIDTGYKKSFGGEITIGGLVFDLHFLQAQTSTIFVATYYHTGAQQTLKIKDLVQEVSSSIASSSARASRLGSCSGVTWAPS